MTSPDYTRRVIETHTVYSTQLQEDRVIKVFLPPDYDASVTYPVLYCHDGNEFFTHGRIATIATQLIAQGEIDPLIIVGIAVHSKYRTADYAFEGTRHERYVRFIALECVPFVEQRYSVRRDVDGRFMAGVSLGGIASLGIHIHFPQLFQRLILFSGAFTESALEYVATVVDWSSLQSFMIVGNEETVVETASGTFDFLKGHDRACDMLTRKGAKVAASIQDGKHIWGFWQKHVPDALAWMQRLLDSSGSR